MSQLRAAVIGLAWGQMHIDALRRAKNVELVAVCDADAERAKVIGKNASVPQAYSDYNEIIKRDDIGLVTVATPPALQREIVSKALSAKKAVLCESPGAMNAQEAQQLAQLSDKTKTASAVAFQTRYLPSYAYAKELIDEDYLGTFLRATITFVMAQPWGLNGNWAADEARGGGVMRNVAVHFIDALEWWFGPADKVMADRETMFSQIHKPVVVNREQKIQKWTATADDTFVALVKFENGGTAVLNFVTGARQDLPWTISLVGSRASLSITSGTLAGKRDTERDFGLLEIPRRLELPDRPREPLMWALCEELNQLVQQQQGETLPGRTPPTFRDAARAHKVMEAIKRSADDMLWASV